MITLWNYYYYKLHGSESGCQKLGKELHKIYNYLEITEIRSETKKR